MSDVLFRKSMLFVLAALMMVAGTVFSANAATADLMQVQSYQRASQTEACVAQPGETPWQANWGSRLVLETFMGAVGQRRLRGMDVRPEYYVGSNHSSQK